MTDAPDPAEVRREFREAVNMTAAELRAHLGSDASREVGQVHAGEAESVGHQYGRHVLDLLARPASHEPSGDEVAQMRKVAGYVHRHLAQRPEGDVTDTRWRASLMNWGHDPLKDERRASRKAG